MIVVWRITQRCNLSCKFCGYDRELRWTRRDADPREVLAFGRVLGDFARTSGERVMVSWLGGEPLLWRPLTALTRTFRQQFGLQLSVTTNGTTLGSPPVREQLLEDYTELTVSVDALGSAHDRLRGAPAIFAELRRGVLALAEEKRRAQRGPLLRANVVLMRQTLPEFRQLCHELARWGIEEITFNQLGGNDRPEFYAANRLLREQVAWLTEELPRLRVELSSCGVRLRGGSDYLRRFAASADGAQLSGGSCPIEGDFLFITEDGRVAPCSFTPAQFGVPLSELTTAEALRKLPARFRNAQRSAKAAPCADCQSTQRFQKFAA
jgi:MoaA/NifB/PqqE/SkfB family radical SAM enzyme